MKTMQQFEEEKADRVMINIICSYQNKIEEKPEEVYFKSTINGLKTKSIFKVTKCNRRRRTKVEIHAQKLHDFKLKIERTDDTLACFTTNFKSAKLERKQLPEVLIEDVSELADEMTFYTAE